MTTSNERRRETPRFTVQVKHGDGWRLQRRMMGDRAYLNPEIAVRRAVRIALDDPDREVRVTRTSDDVVVWHSSEAEE